MKKYQTEFKLEVVKSFLAGEGGAKLLARRWLQVDPLAHLGVSSVNGPNGWWRLPAARETIKSLCSF